MRACGYIISTPNPTAFDGVTGVLFGLLALGIDYIVAMFLLKFYTTNIELSSALKEADDSRSRLEEAYDELTKTKVYEERNRIAKDIHDTVGHSMTTVIMQRQNSALFRQISKPETRLNRYGKAFICLQAGDRASLLAKI